MTTTAKKEGVLAKEALESVFPSARIDPNSAGGLALNAGPYVIWTEFHQTGWDGVQEIGGHYVVKLLLDTGRVPHLVPITELIVLPDDLEDALVDFKETFRATIRDLGRVCGYSRYSHSNP